jgi:hypothetical protein
LRNHLTSICDSLCISWRLAEEPAQKMIDLWRTKTNKAAARIHHVSSEYPVSPELVFGHESIGVVEICSPSGDKKCAVIRNLRKEVPRVA